MILSSALSKKTGAWYTVTHLPYTSFEGMFLGFFQGQSRCALVLYGWEYTEEIVRVIPAIKVIFPLCPFQLTLQLITPFGFIHPSQQKRSHLYNTQKPCLHKYLYILGPCPHLICYCLHDLIALLISSSTTTKISHSDHSALHTSLYCKIQTYPVMLGRKALWDFHAQMSERFILMMMSHSPHS